jgi:hypothetical protein
MRGSAAPRFAVYGIVVVALGLAAFHGPGPAGPRLRCGDIPVEIAHWRGHELAYDPKVSDVPLTADYLARSYSEPGGSTVDLLSVCGEDLGTLSDPAWDLRTHGWRVTRLPATAGLPAAWLRCRREGTLMITGYWFASAAGEGPSLAAQELALGARNLVGRGVRRDVAVFRVAVAGSDERQGRKEAERFVRALLASGSRR